MAALEEQVDSTNRAGRKLDRRPRLAQIAIAVLTMLMVTSCGPIQPVQGTPVSGLPFPPEGFQQADLYGTWQAKYGGEPRTTDTIVLREDGTYQQIYQLAATEYHYESPWYQWSFERRPSGRLYLHLRNMRYCLITDEVCALEGGGTGNGLLYDPGEDRNIKMAGEVVLVVAGVEGMKYPNIEDVPRGIILVHMRPEIDRANVFFTLQE